MDKLEQQAFEIEQNHQQQLERSEAKLNNVLREQGGVLSEEKRREVEEGIGKMKEDVRVLKEESERMIKWMQVELANCKLLVSQIPQLN